MATFTWFAVQREVLTSAEILYFGAERNEKKKEREGGDQINILKRGEKIEVQFCY